MEIRSSVRKKSYLADRGNFMNVGTLAFGLSFAIGLLWMFGGYGSIGWWLFIILLAIVGGRVWSFFMWFVFKSVYAIDETKDG